MSPCTMRRHANVRNILFFSLLFLTTLTALPWYARQVGFSRFEWGLFWFFVIATGLSITIGYHRLFSHRAFTAHPLVRWLSLVFGAAAFEQSALHWASLHRDHHRYVDTPRDPYNIKQGFWYAHIGWLTLWENEPDFTNVPDLTADPVVMHQHKYYLWWAIGFGVLLPMAIGWATGHLLGVFLLAVVGRLTLVHHSTFSINSICHTFGRATYDLSTTARDHWLVALLTNGEGYHNFHHRFASDYRNAIRWYQWDPSKWIIAVLSWVGLAHKLYRASPQSILAARLLAERQRVERALEKQAGMDVGGLLETLRGRYAALKEALNEWDYLEKEYRRLCASVSEQSQIYLHATREKFEEKRRACLAARQRWVRFINSNPLIPRAAHV